MRVHYCCVCEALRLLYPQDTLIALSRVRAEVDLERGRLARKDPTQELEFELSMRTKNNAWVVARTRNGHELFTALEKSGDTLLSASEAMERLSAKLVWSLLVVCFVVTTAVWAYC